MTLKNAINNYLETCRDVKKLEPLTLRAYAVDLAQFYEFVSECSSDITKIDKMLISRYFADIGKKYLAKSLKRKVASLKAFFNYLEAQDLILVTPFRKMQLYIKEPRRIPKALTLAEMEKLLFYLYKRGKSKTDLRNRAVLELMFSTGIRISELCAVRLADINFETQTLTVQGKGNKERTAFISDTAMRAIKAYLRVRAEANSPLVSPCLFLNRTNKSLSTQSVRDFVTRLGHEALGKHITPHMIRHTFATLLLEEGVDITHIKSFLGHSSISTTQIYAVSTTTKQRQILAMSHPRNRIKTP